MNTHPTHRPLALASLVLAPLVPLYAADNDPISRVRLEEPREILNRVSVSYAAGWNFNADFSRVNRKGGGSAGPATGGSVDRVYDDGYNKRSSTSGTGYTWNWGYRNASQVDEANDRLLMHSTRSTGGAIKDVEDDPQHGFQLKFNRQLGRNKDNKWTWGVEAAFGWTFLDIENSGLAPYGSRTITDAYNLNGVRPPWVGGTSDPQYPGHAGTFDGPGTLIEDTPNRSVTTTAITGSRKFDGDFYYLHLGPYFEIPVAEKWSAVISAGVAVGILDGNLHFNEIVSVPETGATRRERGNVSEVDFMIGGYLSATLKYAIDEQWSIFAGGEFQGMTDYEASGKGRKVTLDLSATPFVVAGVSYTF